MPDILHRIGIKSSLGNGLSRTLGSKGIAGWWNGDIKASPAVGAIDQFRFGDSGFNDMEVVELVPGQACPLALCGSRQGKEWIGTELTFDLKQENGRTVVLFAHRGLEGTGRVYALL